MNTQLATILQVHKFVAGDTQKQASVGVSNVETMKIGIQC